ncbi:M48 family metallopeptidase [Sulfurovum sp. XTW-4]|uniref:M48 family metallopeptidase n=1 Tax=Sulfurovum xiamenensis TaxID=3019066 RepID=A0ABT7QRE3_9BACT|nr:M48 family metallopeptidase [Sulfurovum xiamenensis]MDM5263648.1 M48 family metallopeptidase [Sulfurovum xiamenensis]
MINGKWYAQGSAASLDATLAVTSEHTYVIRVENGAVYEGSLSVLNVDNRLGNTERKITLEDGSIFATKENDLIDKIFKKHLLSNGIIHTLESKLRWVFVALVITVFTTFGFFKWGVPWSSTKIAHLLPHETNELIATHTLEFLDKYIFKKSKISQSKMEEIRQHFTSTLVPLSEDQEINYRVHFRLWRDGNVSIPNALALPSGDIILTDKFVELSKSQDEIDSVLLHEMGHVIHRHTLKMVIESTFITVATMMIVGDSNGLADMGVGLGSLLVSSSYSRGHESEADIYAFEQMLAAKIDPIAFSDIMNRMMSYMERPSKNDKNSETSDEDVLDYLSSHPATKERVEVAQQYSQCFKKGLTTCEIVSVPQ